MLIGLGHRKQSGKDTIAEYLVTKYGFRRLAFADLLKVLCGNVFGFSHAQLYGDQHTKEANDPRFGFSPRHAMQTLGEGMRTMFGPDVWLHAIASSLGDPRFPHTVLSDVRYPNEANMLRRRGAILVRVDRPTEATHDAHSSEHSMDTYDYDTVLRNDHDIPKLYSAVDSLLAYYGYDTKEPRDQR